MFDNTLTLLEAPPGGVILVIQDGRGSFLDNTQQWEEQGHPLMQPEAIDANDTICGCQCGSLQPQHVVDQKRGSDMAWMNFSTQMAELVAKFKGGESWRCACQFGPFLVALSLFVLLGAFGLASDLVMIVALVFLWAGFINAIGQQLCITGHNMGVDKEIHQACNGFAGQSGLVVEYRTGHTGYITPKGATIIRAVALSPAAPGVR